MALCELAPGLPPDEAEKLRWQAFGHKHSKALTSAAALADFITRRGFVLTRPQRGMQLPSALEAVVGRPLLGRSFDARTAQLEAWRRECLMTGRLHATAVLGGHATLVSPPFFKDFLAVAAHDDLRKPDRTRAKRGLGPDAKTVCEHLSSAQRPLTRTELEEHMQLRSDPGRARLWAALTEAIQNLRVCEVVTSDGDPDPRAAEAHDSGRRETSSPGATFDLVSRCCGDLLEKAHDSKPATARQRIATRYLRNVLVEGCHEMARVLGWSPDDTLDTLRGLESRKIASQHPASRHNRWFFQANATDLLS